VVSAYVSINSRHFVLSDIVIFSLPIFYTTRYFYECIEYITLFKSLVVKSMTKMTVKNLLFFVDYQL
jgi:hypothetical protein